MVKKGGSMVVKHIGILVFDDVEELDFVGPWEVFATAANKAEATGQPVYRPLLIAENKGLRRCAKALRVLPDTDIASAPPLAILLIPGGQGTRREVNNPPLLNWIAKTAATAEWVTSVCTGALLLCAAGPARGKTVTTHWAFVEALKARGEAKAVRDDCRFVQDGNLVSAAGVSAGIDMALWLVGQLYTPDFARQVQRAIQYAPQPPYAPA